MEVKSGLEIVCSREINCGHGLGILFSKYCEVLGRRSSKISVNGQESEVR